LNSIQQTLSILRRVNQKIPFVFRVICGEKPPSAFAEGLNFEWNRFEHDTEGQLIAGSWLGLAPMEDTPYTKCKGAYKVKTYLAAGLPVVASRVGFQAELVRAGGDVGFLPQSAAEWEEAIITLIGNPSLCSKMGANSRKYATSRFGHPAAISNWVPILQKHFPQLLKSN
jgi:glycosyltransferase involved in cell wall biosynthesis